jgi:hypothetical protein
MLNFVYFRSSLFLEKAGGLQSVYRHITIICIVGQEKLKMAKDAYSVTGAVKVFDVPGLKFKTDNKQTNKSNAEP